MCHSCLLFFRKVLPIKHLIQFHLQSAAFLHCRPHCRVMDGKIIEFCCFMHTLMPAEPFKSLSVCRTLTMTCPGPLALCDIRLCLDKCIQALSAPNASQCFTHHTYAVTLAHAKRKNHVRAQGTERVEPRKKKQGWIEMERVI